MGIQGLLPLLKECQTPTHIREYKGLTLAIDAYVWLHRGAYGCAQEIATGQQTVKYVRYAMHRIRLLKHYGITPYVVFDGGLLPSKMGTETDRESRRDEALTKAHALAREGQHALAREFFVKAVDITPQMAYQLIKVLKAENVAYVVAPYEADAQLAYLERKGIVDGVITEDSDLLVFGCRRVLFKMDSEGACVEIKRDHFTRCREFSFSGWSDVEFRQMAILSGCDYLDNIQGLGIKKAHQLMRKYKNMDKVIKFLRLDGQYKVPLGYFEACRRAELTFAHQRVFCPEQRKLVHLETLPAHIVANLASFEEVLSFVGPDMPDDTALGIALGELCPLSKAKMIDIAPDQDMLALAPSVLPTQGAKTTSIKDWFKPDPTASSSRRRPVKREEVAKPLPILTSTPGPIAQIKSRFFGSATAGPSIRKQSEPSQGSRNATLVNGDDNLNSIGVSTSAATLPSPGLARIGSSRHEAIILSPRRPRQSPSESGFSHISSPISSPRKDKGKSRKEPDDSGYGAVVDDVFLQEDAQRILVDLGPKSVYDHTEDDRLGSDVLDLTSPDAVSAGALPRCVGNTLATRSPSCSPPRRPGKRERSETIAWTSDAQASSPDPGEGVEASSSNALMLSRHSQAARSPPPKRRNATIPKRRTAKPSAPDLSTEIECCTAEGQADQQSIITTWREKFSSSSTSLLSSRASSFVFSAASSTRKDSSTASLTTQRSRLSLAEPNSATNEDVLDSRKRRRLQPVHDKPQRSTSELLSSASDISEETSNSLESFRFRPSQSCAVERR